MQDRDPLAVPIPCSTCRLPMGYANRAKVAQYRRQFGGSIMGDESAIDMIVQAAAIRCPTCHKPSTKREDK